MASGASFNPSMQTASALNASVQKTSSVNEVQPKAAKDISNSSNMEDSVSKAEDQKAGKAVKDVELDKRSTEALKEINDGFARLRMEGLATDSFIDKSADLSKGLREIREGREEMAANLRESRNEREDGVAARVGNELDRNQEFQGRLSEATQAQVDQVQGRQEAYEIQTGNLRVQESQRAELTSALDSLKEAAGDLRALTERLASSDQASRAAENSQEYKQVLDRLQAIEEQRNQIQQQIADIRADERVAIGNSLREDRLESVEQGRALFDTALTKSLEKSAQKEELLKAQDAIKTQKRRELEGREQQERLELDAKEAAARKERFYENKQEAATLLGRQIERVNERNAAERAAFQDQEGRVAQAVEDRIELNQELSQGIEKRLSNSPTELGEGLDSIESLSEKAKQLEQLELNKKVEPEPKKEDVDLIDVFERTGETKRPQFAEEEELVFQSREEPIEQERFEKPPAELRDQSTPIEKEKPAEVSVFDVELPEGSSKPTTSLSASKQLDSLRDQVRSQREAVEKQLSQLQSELQDKAESRGGMATLNPSELSEESLDPRHMIVADSRVFVAQDDGPEELDREDVQETE